MGELFDGDDPRELPIASNLCVVEVEPHGDGDGGPTE